MTQMFNKIIFIHLNILTKNKVYTCIFMIKLLEHQMLKFGFLEFGDHLYYGPKICGIMGLSIYPFNNR